MTVRQYEVRVAYKTKKEAKFTVYAADTVQATEIALFTWRRAYTDKCIEPEVSGMKEIN